MRLDNFTQTVDGEPAIDLLERLLGSVERAALKKKTVPPVAPDENPQWKARDRYALRSLEGVWATSPYLHNGARYVEQGELQQRATVGNELSAPERRALLEYLKSL